MFERFTPNARRVVVVGQDVARDMGHRRINPEHLLVALRESEGMASIAMSQAGVDAGVLHDRVAGLEEPDAAARSVDKVPFSHEAKKSLELALRAALSLGHNYIGTEHLLLGVEREAEQRSVVLDDLLGADITEVHARLMDLLTGSSKPPPAHSPAMQSVLDAARGLADRAPLTTAHVLRGMFSAPDSQGAMALAALGITIGAVEEALEAIPVADTSDDTSPQAFSVTVGSTTTEITDPDVATALQQLTPEQLRQALREAVGLASPQSEPKARRNRRAG